MELEDNFEQNWKEDSQFMYFSGSKDVAPGLGASELLSEDDKESDCYAELKVT
jgi:hypothetical protein